VVCYHTNPIELQTLMNSVFAAVACAKELWCLAVIPLTIIDNSKTDGLCESDLNQFMEMANSLDVELKLIHGHGNVGYGRAHNMALANLQSDFHLFSNPDVVLDSECLSVAFSYLLGQPDAVLVSPFATNKIGEKQYLCKRYPSVFTLFVRGFLPSSWQDNFRSRLAHYEMRKLSDEVPTASVPIASGCFMLCRSEALRGVGGFDERYFLYFEDFDLSLRLGKLGQIAYVPSMKITHGGGNAAKKGFKHIAMFIRSGIRFFNTHGWRWF
jgi:GT2 family glycosyltransferase